MSTNIVKMRCKQMQVHWWLLWSWNGTMWHSVCHFNLKVWAMRNFRLPSTDGFTFDPVPFVAEDCWGRNRELLKKWKTLKKFWGRKIICGKDDQCLGCWLRNRHLVKKLVNILGCRKNFGKNGQWDSRGIILISNFAVLGSNPAYTCFEKLLAIIIS